MYIDMKMQEEPVKDEISGPASDIGGALYGAVEFSQVDKLMPGSKEVIKGFISNSLKRTIGRMVLQYGKTWAQEVGEEGVQQVIQETTMEVSNRIAGQSNKTVGKAVGDILISGWEAMKQSALPMLFLMVPGASVDAVRTGTAINSANKANVEKELNKITDIVSNLKQSGDADNVQIKELQDAQSAGTETGKAGEQTQGMEQGTQERLHLRDNAKDGVEAGQGDVIQPPSGGLEKTGEAASSASPAPTQSKFVTDNVTPETIKKRPTGLSLLDEKLAAIEKKQAMRQSAQEALDYLKQHRKDYLKRIAPHKDGTLAEEYQEIPVKYRNKKGIPMDEIASEIPGISEADLSSYFQDLDSQIKRLENDVEANKTQYERISELTKIKRSIKDMMQGINIGKREAKAQIKDYQSQVLNLIRGLGLEASDRAKFLASVKNANTEQSLNKEIESILDRANRYAEAQEKRKVKAEIAKELKTTKPVKQGPVKKGKYDYETNKAFNEFRDINKLTKSNAHLRLADFPTEDLSNIDLMKRRLLELKANGADASVELHNQVLADIKRLKQLGKMAKNEADFFNLIEDKQKIDEWVKGIEKVEADKETIKTKIGNLYRQGFANIYSMFNSVAGKDIAEKYDPEINESDKAKAIGNKVTEIKKKVAKILGLDNKELIIGAFMEMQADKFDLYDTTGNRWEVSRMELMDIYNSIKNKLGDERYNNAFGEQQIRALLNELTPQEIEIADLLFDELQSYFPVINRIHIKRFGVDLRRVNNYWPFTSEHAPDLFDDYKTQGELLSAEKERSESTKIFPIPKNAWFKAVRHISQAEHADKLSPSYINLKKILSDRTVRNRIVNKFGDDVYLTMLDQLENISLNKATAREDLVSGIADKALNNWVIAKTAVPNFSIFAKQLVSVGNYAEDMPVGEWSRKFFEGISSPKETFDFMWNNSGGFLEQRFNRGYSEAVASAVDGASKISLVKYSWTKGLTAFSRAGDITAIIYGGYARVKYEMENGKTMDEAFRIFEKATLKAQQSPLASGRSQWQNNSNSIARMALAFKNTANQYLRKQVDAIISYQNGDISAKQLVKTTIIYSVINPILYAAAGIATKELLKGIGYALFGAIHDEEADVDSILMDIMTNILTSPFMAIPVIDDLSVYALKKATDQQIWKIFSTPILTDIETGVRELGKDYVSLVDYFDSFGVGAEVTTGAPVKTIIRMYKYLTGD